ncbi:MAG: prepilin-type N-terminal cleavage/methylation domain-containing protein [Candidatus Omnitrophica bacterium]|nr:hypothetical protein [bacterium]NUN96353.1 prepilin-type N-terminal cleavage/methylation domain-containing protein [Candidatus Omnitrophota bacterium]
MSGRRGMTLIELMAVMLSALLVGAMGFHLMFTSTKSVHQRMSVLSRGERLRLLQTAVSRDLAGRFPAYQPGGVSIASPNPESASQTLLRANVLVQGEEPNVDLREVIYTVEEPSPGSGQRAVIRSLDPDLAPGRSSQASLQNLFTLEFKENLVWSATPVAEATGPTLQRLVVTLTDERFKDRPVSRELRIVEKKP